MAVVKRRSGIKPSAQQKAIYTACRKGGSTDNFIVRARAGTGKTTTILTGTEHAPEKIIVVAAFNKRIAEELQRRITSYNVKAKTLHGMGYGILRRYWPQANVAEGRARVDGLTNEALRAVGEETRVPFAVKRLIGRLHTAGREALPHATRSGELVDLAESLDLIPDPQYMAQGFDVDFIESRALAAMELATRQTAQIDFADMIFLPCRMGWHNPVVDFVLVDEAQDMTAAQLELARGVCRGRLAIVGDDRQAIYGFRGADTGSLDRLKEELSATEFGLTVTYRCGLAIVELAKQLVPDFEAAPGNPDGQILELQAPQLIPEAQPGDFILSRVNAPLAEIAMGLLRANKRVRIAGRDLGSGLIALINRLAGDNEDVNDFLRRLTEWKMTETQRLIDADREHRVGAVEDKAGVLAAFGMDATTVSDIRNKVQMLFTDDGLGDASVVTCSSIHRAKGLEADKVFILWDTLRRDSMEEQNLEYVAVTRAKETLVKVYGIGGRPVFGKKGNGRKTR